MSRLFTLDEARALLPVLRPLLLEMRKRKQELDEREKDLSEVSQRARSNGHSLESKIAAAKQAVDDAAEALKQAMLAVSETGVEIKDLDMALIDFPSRREGRIVNLCWYVDEEDIGYWHETNKGFMHRKPL